MEKMTTFSQEVLDAMENAMDIAEEYLIEESTPIILFKGIIDLDENPLYDFLISNTYYESSDIEEAFEEVISDIFEVKETKKSKGKEKKKEKSKVKKQKKGKNIIEEKSTKEEEKYYFCINKNENERELLYSKDFAFIMSRAIQLAQDREPSLVKLEDLLCAIVEDIPNDILLFLRKLSVNVRDFKYTFNMTKIKEDIIPIEMSSFMKVLNIDFEKGTECSILGRDKECSIIWRTIQKKTKRNAILIGEPGVGKSSIVKKITHDIVNENCPEAFKDFIVISLDVTSIIAGTKYRGMAEERFTQVSRFIEEHNNVLLFIDEIHLIMGAGATKDDPMDFANALKPILAEDKAIVIGATTIKEYKKYFSKDEATRRRFKTIEVKEPTCDKVYPMIKNKVKELSKAHNVKISTEIVDFIIFTSSCFNYETKNPDRTLDAIDLAMVAAKSKGKKSVDKQSVLEIYDINFEMYNKMDYKVKKSTAYHEAGHYIMHRLSEYIKDIKPVAVSIMPADSYLGINVFDVAEDVTVNKNYAYYIEAIACKLAGRVAEKMYTKDISSGANSDIESATKIAYELVTKYGMVASVGPNRIFINNEDYSMLSDKTIDNINDEIEKIIDEAYKKAEQVISKNEVFLKILANALMKKGMLSAKEIDVLFEKTYSKENKAKV